MRVVLTVIKSVNAAIVGKEIVFDGYGMFTIGRPASDGRNRKLDGRIPGDPYMSRGHMQITVSPSVVLLHDISTHGTAVNGERVRATSFNGQMAKLTNLKDGDIIVGGKTRFRARIESRPELPQEVSPTGQGTVDSDDPWKTKICGRVGACREVKCLVCREVATDSLLNDLTDTGLTAYVCQSCLAKQRNSPCPIPNYEKLAMLGTGSLGVVLKARRLSDGKIVALKVLAPEMCAIPELAKTFLRQMRLCAKLSHPKLVPIVQMGQAGNQLWLATEYVDGIDARRLRQQLKGKLPLADAIDIACQTLEGLSYAHGKSLVHRDVKPSNILVAGQPGGYDARLADFGLIKNINEAGMSQDTFTGEGVIRGTVPFMSREQVEDCRFVQPQGDIYGAAASLYWQLTGEFVRDFEVRDKHGEIKNPYAIILDDPIVPLRKRDPSIPASVARVVEKALADDPEDRFEKATQMADALQEALRTTAR
jgi:serine/threonine-protein kinase